jgi:hypothetical protein
MWMQNIYYLQKIEEEVNNHARSGLEKQLAKKRLNVCIGGVAGSFQPLQWTI